jgi:hypothetical protein
MQALDQRTVQGENDGNLTTRNVMKAGIIEQAGNEGSDSDRKTGPVAVASSISYRVVKKA